jgi:redox-sensitive bicupin YhaK (pirin superfamily)
MAKAWRHLSSTSLDHPSRSGWACSRGWNDDEIAANATLALQVHTNIAIVTYVREGTVTWTRPPWSVPLRRTVWSTQFALSF